MKRARIEEQDMATGDKTEIKVEVKSPVSTQPEVPDFTFDERLQIWAFGDSITQQGYQSGGWLSLLADAYVRKADVFNRGFSGYNTNHATILLTKQMQKWFQPVTATRLVTVFFGANDAALHGISDQHVSLEDYEANLKRVIHSLQNYMSKDEDAIDDDDDNVSSLHVKQSNKVTPGSLSVVLITPPPVDDDAFFQTLLNKPNSDHKQTNRHNKQTGKYAEVVIKLAHLHSLPCVDVYSQIMQQSDWKSYLSDGLHLNSKGNAFLYECVLKCIQTYHPELTPSALPIEAPLWDKIDKTNPSTSFDSIVSSSPISITGLSRNVVKLDGVMAIEQLN